MLALFSHPAGGGLSLLHRGTAGGGKNENGGGSDSGVAASLREMRLLDLFWGRNFLMGKQRKSREFGVSGSRNLPVEVAHV